MNLKKIITAIASFVLCMAVFVSTVYAWDYSAAANSQCETTNEVSIWIRFTNAEILNSGHTLHVVATDEQTGAFVDMGDIIAKDTVDKTIYTGVAVTANGKVRFDITSVNGWTTGSETTYATYSGKTCGNGIITPAFSATPVATATPAPTPTVTPSSGGGCGSCNTTTIATPSPVVTSTPEAGQSAIPSDNRSDNLGCSVHDCSGTVVARGGEVAGATSGSVLPSTGAELWYSVAGAAYVALSGYALRRFAQNLK
jgi:hypothetical protein